MGKFEEPSATSPSGESRARTPVYASFDSSTDKLSHLLKFILRGIQGFSDELKTKLEPEVIRLGREVEHLGTPRGKEMSDREARRSTEMMEDGIQRISDT